MWVLSMKLTLTALTVATLLIASGASAFDPADLQKLKDTNKCVECDLSVADLMEANLEDAILCNTIMPDGSVIYSGC